MESSLDPHPLAHDVPPDALDERLRVARGERAGIPVGGEIIRQHVLHVDAGQVDVWSALLGELSEDPVLRCAATGSQQHPHDEDLAVRAEVDEVLLDRRVGPVDLVLRAAVEVELQQVPTLVIEGDECRLAEVQRLDGVLGSAGTAVDAGPGCGPVDVLDLHVDAGRVVHDERGRVRPVDHQSGEDVDRALPISALSRTGCAPCRVGVGRLSHGAAGQGGSINAPAATAGTPANNVRRESMVSRLPE